MACKPILAVEPGALEQRHVHKLAARGFDEFLVRQARENISGGHRAFREKEGLLRWLFGGAGERCEGND